MQILLTNPKNGKDYLFELYPTINRLEYHESPMGGYQIDDLRPIYLVVERQRRRFIREPIYPENRGLQVFYDIQYVSDLDTKPPKMETITSWDISDLIVEWSQGPWSTPYWNNLGHWHVCYKGELHQAGLSKKEAEAIVAEGNHRDAVWPGLLEKLEEAVIEVALKGEL